MCHGQRYTLRKIAPLALALTCVLSGCLPNVAWLPDSSGFVYVGDKGQLVLWDAATKAEKILVTDTETCTFVPAISADGKRIAVARLFADDSAGDEVDLSLLQVIVYSRDGAELSRSDEMPWRFGKPKRPMPEPMPTMLYWSPRGDKLLIEGDDRTGIYDLATRRLRVFPSTNLMVVGTSPIRPDGKGFLLCQFGDGPDRHVDFVDWTGRRTKLALPPDLFKNNEREFAVRWPQLHAAHWHENAAIIRGAGALIRLDTATRTGTLAGMPPTMTADNRPIHSEFAFPDSPTRVRVVIERARNEEKQALYRVEVVSAGDEGRVVAERVSLCALVPSPNRAFVAVVFQTEDSDGMTDMLTPAYLVVDRHGHVLAGTRIGQWQ